MRAYSREHLYSPRSLRESVDDPLRSSVGPARNLTTALLSDRRRVRTYRGSSRLHRSAPEQIKYASQELIACPHLSSI
jgi:hypothetical protein